MKTVWRAHVALLMVQLFFGCLPVMGKVVMATVSPMGLVLLRIFGAAAILWILRTLQGVTPVAGWQPQSRLLVYSILGIVLNQVLFLEGLSRTTAINASVLTTLIPIFTTLMSMASGRERATPRRLAGVGISLSGALLLVGVDGFDLSNRYVLGNVLIVANTLCYSAYLILSKPMLETQGSLRVVSGVFLWGAILVLPWSVPVFHSLQPVSFSGSLWLLIAAIILFPTVGSYLLNSWSLKQLNPSVVAIYIYLQPIVASLLGCVWLGETVTARTGAAASLVLIGLTIVTRPEKPAP